MPSYLKKYKARALARPDVCEAYAALGAEVAFLDELLRARAEAGLTQAQLAERVGTTQSAIVPLESGELKHSPSIATLQRYARAPGYRVEVTFVKEQGLTSTSIRTRRERGSRLAG